MTTTIRRIPAVTTRMTGALTTAIVMALLAGCGAPDRAGEAASPAPEVPAAASSAATSDTPLTPPATPSPGDAPAATPGESGAAEPSAGTSAADVTFARQMVPHHLQALEMARIAQTRAEDPWVRDFAAKVATARDADIRTLNGWLNMWGAEPLPRDHAMPGTQTRAEIEALAKLDGLRFDRKYVTLMIEHDNGAIKLARTEQAEGAFAGAKALAVATATALGAEVKELKKYRDLLD